MAYTPTSRFGAQTPTSLSFRPVTVPDSKGFGLSEMAYQFTAGLVEHAESLVAVACPIVNSYKRMGVGAPPREQRGRLHTPPTEATTART